MLTNLQLIPRPHFIHPSLDENNIQSDQKGDQRDGKVGNEKYEAHGGMSKAAWWLHDKLGPVFWHLLKEYEVIIVGHSMGGGAAALLTALLAHPSLLHLPSTSPLPPSPLRLRCFTYASPSCVDASLATLLAQSNLVLSCVNHNDLIPHLNMQSLAHLSDQLFTLYRSGSLPSFLPSFKLPSFPFTKPSPINAQSPILIDLPKEDQLAKDQLNQFTKDQLAKDQFAKDQLAKDQLDKLAREGVINNQRSDQQASKEEWKVV